MSGRVSFLSEFMFRVLGGSLSSPREACSQLCCFLAVIGPSLQLWNLRSTKLSHFVFFTWLHQGSASVHSPPAVCLLCWIQAGEELTRPYLSAPFQVHDHKFKQTPVIQAALPCLPICFPTLLPSVQHLILHAHSPCAEKTHMQEGTHVSFAIASIWLSAGAQFSFGLTILPHHRLHFRCRFLSRWTASLPQPPFPPAS